MNSNLQLGRLSFVPGNARELAQASHDAYSRWDLLGTGGHGAHVLLTEYDDCWVIAVRGSKSIEDWITDALFFWSHTPAGRVHTGFMEAGESVLPLLAQKLRTALQLWPRNVKPLVLTGHSLGGAIAGYLALRLREMGFVIDCVYTFGQPRIGDAQWRDNYNDLLGTTRTFRVVNENDIVPRLPGLLLGYRHQPNHEFINVAGKLLENPSLINLAISDALGLYQAYRFREDVLISDHFMEGGNGYLTHLYELGPI